MQSFGQAGRAVICELLASSSQSHRRLGASGAWHAAPAGADDIVPALLAAYAAYADAEVLAAIEWNRDPRMVPVLIEALSGPGAPRTSGAVVALDRLGAQAAPALPALAEVAASHWDASTRQDAASACRSISRDAALHDHYYPDEPHLLHDAASAHMQELKPGPYRCPRIVSQTRHESESPVRHEAESLWTVTLASRRIELRGLPAEPASWWEQAGGPCATVGRHELVQPVADECLTSDPGFECGGSLRVWHDGKSIDLGDASPARFVPRSTDVLFFESCSHMMNTWEVESLQRDAPRTWERRIIAAADWSELVAWAIEATGAIDLLVQDSGPPYPGKRIAPCAERTRVEGVSQKDNSAFVLVQARPDGTVAALE